ncbi:hypothetical protein EVAR_84832_1 [Eumeta japonica]|uniref:Uncharacterized protein n=1 Tax=Eumeta variegata TaxID=151549 RepID=A0A4C1U864_EUMVA|nr:hypothetical protein EVAR_84832_1 [Eumeta japonica]
MCEYFITKLTDTASPSGVRRFTPYSRRAPLVINHTQVRLRPAQSRERIHVPHKRPSAAMVPLRVANCTRGCLLLKVLEVFINLLRQNF